MTTPLLIATAACNVRARAWPADPCCWLSPAELDEWDRLRHRLRRNEWLGGRWLIKCMLRPSFTGIHLSGSPEDARRIEILSRDAAGRPQAPRTYRDGRALSAHVSLAHVDGIVWAAVSRRSTVRVGIDVLPARPVAERLLAAWFTPDEHAWARRGGGELRGAAVWSAKEAVYKATNCGEPFDPARCEIHPDDGERWSWTVRGVAAEVGDAVSVREIGGVFVALATAVQHAPGDVGAVFNACECDQPDVSTPAPDNLTPPARLSR